MNNVSSTGHIVDFFLNIRTVNIISKNESLGFNWSEKFL